MNLKKFLPSLPGSRVTLKESGLLWLVAFLMLIGAAVYIPAVVYVSSTVGEQAEPIYSVDTDKKEISLTFDLNLTNEDIPEILSVLAKHNVQASFFMTGTWVSSYPEEVKSIAAAGHDLGNHGEKLKEMSVLTSSQVEDDLMQVHNKVKSLTGIDMQLFRPPYGNYDSQLITRASDCGYQTIQWSVDSLDWKDYGVKSIIKTVTQNTNMENGAIILLHNGTKYTAQALDAIITSLGADGYTFVPVSALIAQ